MPLLCSHSPNLAALSAAVESPPAGRAAYTKSVISVLVSGFISNVAAEHRLRIAGTSGIVEYIEGLGVSVVSNGKPPRKFNPLPPAKSFFADWLESVHNGKPSGLSLADIYRANEIVLEARDAADQFTPARYLAARE